MAFLGFASLAFLAVGQIPQALDFPASPEIVSTGGAAAARIGHASAVWLNPAALATTSSPALEVSFFETSEIDQSGFSVLGAVAGPLGSDYALVFRQKAIADLVEDPAMDDGDIRVADTVLRLAVARSLVGDRVALGVSGTAAWSTVVATDGRALFVDVGGIVRLHPLLALGVSWRRLGSGYRWEAPGGGTFETGLAPGVRVGATLGRVALGPVAVLWAGDVEAGSSLGGTELGLGVDALVARVLSLRVGVARAAGADAVMTGGLGLALEGLRLDLAYEASHVVGSRLHVGLGYGSPRRAAEGGEE